LCPLLCAENKVYKTLLNFFERKYCVVFSYFPQARKLFDDSLNNFLQNFPLDTSHNTLLKNKFTLFPIVNGWISSHKIRLSKGLPPDLSDFTYIDFISFFHPNRKVRLASDKLRRKLDLNVTSICNYKCEYCYQKSRDDWKIRATRAKETELSILDLKKIIFESSLLGAKYIKITGGEPLTKEGLFDLIEYAINIRSLKEVELLSNGSILALKLNKLRKSIKGNEKKFHLHLSIDGISKEEKNNKTSISHLNNIKKIISSLPDIKISVNSMWSGSISYSQLKKLYFIMYKYKVFRWTISFPYLVKTLIAAVKVNPNYTPKFKTVVQLSEKLIKLHSQMKKPFRISIPLIYKHEFDDSLAEIASDGFEDHPCVPCHGSYFIIGSKGEILECLLAPPGTKTNTKTSNLLESLIESTDSPFYNLNKSDVSKNCKGCRYEMMCCGQCVNDKSYNFSYIFNKENDFGKDKTACSLLTLSERYIWPKLGHKERRKIFARINKKGFKPNVYNNISDMLSDKENGKKNNI
jgi:radical SAM protein with 4Fe4S-binding SPASM domain